MVQLNRVRELVAVARANVAELANDSLCREAATAEWFDKLAEYPPESPQPYLPNLLPHLSRLTVDELRVFDDDVKAVRAASPSAERFGGFISTGTRVNHRSTRQWFAGRAELGVLATLVANVEPDRLRIEPKLPNRKVADAAVRVGSRWIWVEITALTESDAEYKRQRPDVNIRVSYGDPYLDARRMYRKAFDKIAGTAETMRGQLHPTEPSVLVIADGSTDIGFASPGIEWAVAQMLHPDQREGRSDASLEKWVAHDYPDRPGEASDRLAHLSAISLVGYDLQPIRTEPNDAPDDGHRLTGDELEELNALLRVDRPWATPANP